MTGYMHESHCANHMGLSTQMNHIVLITCDLVHEWATLCWWYDMVHELITCDTEHGLMMLC